MRVVVLGCGFHGRGIAYQLAETNEVSELVVADSDGAQARKIAQKIGADWKHVDVRDQKTLKSVLAGAHTVFNATGPYHLYGLKVIQAAIQTGVNYVDMNDDYEVADAVFLDPAWEKRAKQAGTAVLLNCGVLPGLASLLGRYGYDQLQHTERILIRFAWNYSREYPAAIQHCLRINGEGLGTQYIDGEYRKVEPFSGLEEVTFLDPVGTIPVYYIGLPDTVSFPRFLPGLREVTTKGAYYQNSANDFNEAMLRWGFTSYETIEGLNVSPMDFLMAYLKSPQGTAFDIPPRDVPLAGRVEIEGSRNGKAVRLTYELQDYSRRTTTAFAALATKLIITGGVAFTGVGTPESSLPPREVLAELLKDPYIKIFAWESGGAPSPFQV
jgi:lysine 6-dehydrogenase